MPKIHKISEEAIILLREARKRNKDKQAEKRLYAVQLRGEGLGNEAIAEKLETSPGVVSIWVRRFVRGGVTALLPKQRKGNHRNMSYEEEAALLATYQSRAESGQIVEVSEIKRAYDKLLGRETASNQIYYVLARHGWRKIKPRSKHPKKASDEVIEASKKLTIEHKI